MEQRLKVKESEILMKKRKLKNFKEEKRKGLVGNIKSELYKFILSNERLKY